MHYVAEVPFRVACKTRLWLSAAAQRDLIKYRKRKDPDGRFWKRIERGCQNGFATLEFGEWPPCRYEWDGVYRVGFIDSLFRLIGFYEDPKTKADFVVIDTLMKRGQDLGAADKAPIDEVARVKQERLWKRVKQ